MRCSQPLAAAMSASDFTKQCSMLRKLAAASVCAAADWTHESFNSKSVSDLASAPLFFGHLIFDDTDDGHKDGSAHAATGHVSEDALQVETAAAGRRGSHYHLEERAPYAATDNAGNGIPKGAQAALFHRCPSNIAADSTTDYLKEKTNDVHRVFCGLIFLSLFRCDVLLAKAAT
jgi:hypothetical protein